MARLAAEHPASIHESVALQDVSDFVRSITRAMKTIAQLYATSLDDSRLDAEMLLGMLSLGAGSTRKDFEAMFGFTICAPGEVLDRLIEADFVAVEPNDMLHPTAETQAVFRHLSRIAQQENLRWRSELQSIPGGSLVLDDFLKMLRTSQHE